MSFRSFVQAVSLAFIAASASACAYGVDDNAGDSASDSSTQSVTDQSGNLRLTVDNHAAWEDRNGARVVVLRARTNRKLADAFSWVPDDAFGRVVMLTPKTFEILLESGHEVNTILSGAPLFLTLHPSSGPTTHAKVELAPAFSSFDGTSKLWITEDVRPIYAKDDVDPLRYRGKVSSKVPLQLLTVFTDDDSDPEVFRVDEDSYYFDWRYDALALASDPPSDPVHFYAKTTSGATLSKRAGLYLEVAGLELTNDDPWVVWESPTCLPETLACIEQTPADASDFAACGDYREVNVCMGLDPCANGTVPASLSPLDIEDEVGQAQSAYNDDCSRGGTWCSVSVTGYTLPQCVDSPVAIADVVGMLQQQDQGMLVDGAYGGRAELEASTVFGSGYSSWGPGLLLAIDVLAGGGEVHGYIATSEVPCHNCHDFVDDVVLYYPLTGVVVRVVGTHGYDS